MISDSRPYGWFSTRIRRSSFTTSRSRLNAVVVHAQRRHAVGFEPQRQRQVLRRQRLPEHRLVFGGVGVAAAADAGDDRRVRLGLDVLRALEHHVLEEVREPGAARPLVLRADVIPDRDVHDRRRVILGEDHAQPVRQRRDLILKLRRPDRGVAAATSATHDEPRRRSPRVAATAEAEAPYDSIIPEVSGSAGGTRRSPTSRSRTRSG